MKILLIAVKFNKLKGNLISIGFLFRFQQSLRALGERDPFYPQAHAMKLLLYVMYMVHNIFDVYKVFITLALAIKNTHILTEMFIVCAHLSRIHAGIRWRHAEFQII